MRLAQEPTGPPADAPLPDAAPRTIARAYLDSGVTLRHYAGDFYRFNRNVYVPVRPERLRAWVADFADGLQIAGSARTGLSTYRTNRSKLGDLIDALAGLTQVHQPTMPAWLDKHRPDPRHTIAAQNGILDVESFAETGQIVLTPPTEEWFSTNVLPFELRADAPGPTAWWDFLASIWPDDVEAVDTLAEWFGYCMSADCSQQKMLMLIGPKRGGKGTVCGVLSQLVGADNVAGPSLAGLAGAFGLWGLLNKQLAIIADARMSGRTDASIIIERLLSISGQDLQLIDRKNREPLNDRLPTRIMIVSNELPKLLDASGAIADRFVTLSLRESFLGREDTTLAGRLTAELPGIALWALNGLRRLRSRGRFVTPRSSIDAADELRELVSPILAFVAERCEQAPGRSVEIGQLYEAWKSWSTAQGRDRPGTAQSFARDLRAAVPVATRQPRVDGERVRVYEGIGLKEPVWGS